MATKISNVMVENEVTKNIVLLFATPFWKMYKHHEQMQKKKIVQEKTWPNKTN
jgi:hypothetical protein